MNNYIDSMMGFIVGLIVACLVFIGHYVRIYQVPYFPEIPTVEEIEEARKPKACIPPPAAPLLSAPEYAQNLPESLQTNRESEVRVSWQDVEGAKSYRVVLRDMQGKIVKRYTTSNTALVLTDIPNPSDLEEVSYQVSLATINMDEKDGPEGSPRPLRVRRPASVTAPTVKNIVIED